MRQGKLTPATVWIKPKPYIDMVIKGLKSRGRPHITYVKTVEQADPNQDEVAQGSGSDAGAPGGNAIENCTLHMTLPMVSESSASPAILESPIDTFPSTTSPAPCFTDEFGRPIYGTGAPPSQFFNAGMPQFRPPPPQLPPRAPTNEYQDFQTRIW